MNTFNNGDIVRILPKNKEGLIIDFGVDLETLKIKYAVYTEERKELFFCLPEDLVFISTLDEELEANLASKA